MKQGRTILGSALVYAASTALIGIIPLALLPLLTRVLTPEEYGVVAMFTLVMQVTGLVSGLSVHGAIGIRYFDRDALDFPRYVGTCLAIFLASFLVMLALVASCSAFIERFTQVPPQWLIIAVIASGFAFIAQMQLAIWQSAKMPLRFAGLRLSQAMLDLGLSLLLVVALGFAWEGRTAGVAAGAVAAGAFALTAMWRGAWVRFPADWGYAKNALRFGLPLVPHAIGGLLIAMVDRLMITNILDVASTGIYMVGVQIGLMVLLVVDAIARAVSPWLIEGLKANDHQRDLSIVRWTYIYFLTVIGFSLAIGLAAPPLLGILVGEQFRAAGAVVLYLTVGQAIGGMYQIMSNYVFYGGRTATLALITLAGGLINVGISYVLLKEYGLQGAAIAFLCGQSTLFLGTWWLGNRARPMPWLKALSA